MIITGQVQKTGQDTSPLDGLFDLFRPVKVAPIPEYKSPAGLDGDPIHQTPQRIDIPGLTPQKATGNPQRGPLDTVSPRGRVDPSSTPKALTQSSVPDNQASLWWLLVLGALGVVLATQKKHHKKAGGK